MIRPPPKSPLFPHTTLFRSHLVKSATRSYDNSLRTEQAAATRERVVDAAVEVLSQGADKLSIPAVAAEASVSVPTVYRHFPDRKSTRLNSSHLVISYAVFCL